MENFVNNNKRFLENSLVKRSKINNIIEQYIIKPEATVKRSKAIYSSYHLVLEKYPTLNSLHRQSKRRINQDRRARATFEKPPDGEPRRA